MKWKTYPKYKPSGVEWLGEVPEHWEVKRLKHLCVRSAIYGANEPADSYESEGVRFLRTTDINDEGNIVGEGVYLPKDTVKKYILEDGDILFSRSGTIGRSFLYKKDKHEACAYAGYLVRFIPGPLLDSSFAFYFSKSKIFQHWLAENVIYSTIGNVNGQKFANLEIPCPTYTEQHDIAAFLDRETGRIDDLIQGFSIKETSENDDGLLIKLVGLLQEYRMALITAAVTGKIDIRDLEILRHIDENRQR